MDTNMDTDMDTDMDIIKESSNITIGDIIQTVRRELVPNMAVSEDSIREEEERIVSAQELTTTEDELEPNQISSIKRSLISEINDMRESYGLLCAILYNKIFGEPIGDIGMDTDLRTLQTFACELRLKTGEMYRNRNAQAYGIFNKLLENIETAERK